MIASRVRGLAAFVCAVTMGWQARAEISLHATGSASVGYTDNYLGAPTHPLPGQPGPLATSFITLTPGAVLFENGARSLHRFDYAHQFTIFPGHSDANGHADIVNWSGLFLLSPRDELTLSINASRTRANLMALRSSAYGSSQMISPMPEGKTTLLGLTMAETFVHDYSAHWRSLQTTSFGLIIPTESPSPTANRYTGLGSYGLERIAGQNAYAVIGSVTYYRTDRVTSQDRLVADATDTLIFQGLGRWRRDWSEAWSTDLEAGLARANPTSDFATAIWGPVGRAAARYTFTDVAAAEASYMHTFMPTLMAARLTSSDIFSLTGEIPISRQGRVFFYPNAGYMYLRSLDVERMAIASTAWAWHAGAVLTWIFYPGFSASASYDHFQQQGNQADIAPLPTFYRNTAMLTLQGTLPAADIPRVPRGQAGRVDGTDRSSLAPSNRDVAPMRPIPSR